MDVSPLGHLPAELRNPIWSPTVIFDEPQNIDRREY